MSDADLHFYFDPVCPFAWITSKWVRMVADQRDYTVDWRFISLRLINAHRGLRPPLPGRLRGLAHTAGLRLLRVAARTRAEHGRACDRAAVRGDRRPGFRPPAAEPDRRRWRVSRHPDLPRAHPGCGRHCLHNSRTRWTRTSFDAESAPRGGRGPGADRQGRRDTDHAVPAAGRRRVLRPGDQPPAHRRGQGGPAVGQRAWGWRVSRASPSSNAACANGRSYASFQRRS